MSEVLFMVRVKLPNSGGYSAGPSGDTEYEDAYEKALGSSLPSGFQYVKRRAGEHRFRDQEGYTYLPVFCVDEKESLALAIQQRNKAYQELSKFIDEITKAALESAKILLRGHG